MKLRISKQADITKTADGKKEYYLITQPLKIEHAYDLLDSSRVYILGKEIARSNALALMRIIKQTTQYRATIKIYTPKIPGRPAKILIEITAKHFPRMTLYVNPGAIEPLYPEDLRKKTKILEAYIPRKTYKQKTRKATGEPDERHNKRPRTRRLQKR